MKAKKFLWSVVGFSPSGPMGLSTSGAENDGSGLLHVLTGLVTPHVVTGLIAAVVTALLVGGTALLVQAHGCDTSLIHACYEPARGTLRIVGACQTCIGAKETPLDWNQAGVQGPQGPTGPQGVAGPPGPAFPITCPPDSVLTGTTCIDKYEASVWAIPAEQTGLIKMVQDGKATLADLMTDGATQQGAVGTNSCSNTDYPSTFPVTGNWTAPLYAVSIPGILPSACASWFQAEQACRLSGKRLLTNQEWQAAAAGTPDLGNDNLTTDCNITPVTGVVNTSSRSACVSKWGAFDMVGNVSEWVGDWGARADGATVWFPAGFGNDRSAIGDVGSSDSIPGALRRGGAWVDGTGAGVFFVSSTASPNIQEQDIGFRCAR
jgi:hypothetical protein